MFLKVTKSCKLLSKKQSVRLRKGDFVEIVEVFEDGSHKLRIDNKYFIIETKQLHQFTELIGCQTSKSL